MRIVPRFTIGGLLALIVLSGVAFAAFRSPTPLWANAFYTTALVMLMAAVLNVIFARGARQRFWVGYLVCGGGYFLVCFLPALKDDMPLRLVTTPALEWLHARTVPAPSQTRQINTIWVTAAQGVTTTANSTPIAIDLDVSGQPSTAIANQVGVNRNATLSYRLTSAGPNSLAAWTAVEPPDGVGLGLGNITLQTSLSYRRLGHSLFAVLFGVVGGLMARWAFREPADVPGPIASAGPIPQDCQ